MNRHDPLAPFHPVVRSWFQDRLGTPTDVQARAWPVIAEGAHILATAPTGSGKTLAAFLWGLNQLLTGTWQSGRVRVLYVSPLKALNNDIERNLLAPLAELEAAFESAGISTPEVRVATRSGDTSQADRRRMLRHPPEILITTPESLNILLTSSGGRQLLTGIESVILDEVHSVIAGKRGIHLITAVDRLVLLSGEFQRIALSATVRPLEAVADFVGGWILEPRGDDATFRRRAVRILEGVSEKRYEVTVDFPADLLGRPVGGVERPTLPLRAPGAGRSTSSAPDSVQESAPDTEVDPDLLWARLAAELKATVRRNRSSLVFANSRRLAERVTRLINEEEPTDLVYSHHGSLAREIRTTVEERFKEGRLAGIVATNSLELGIDIGDLDEVVLLQTPFSIASAVQRVGRAGHSVGAVSRGTFYPLFGRDLIAATVVAKAVETQDIEPMQPVSGALDILAQVILSMTTAEEWSVDALYDQIRTSSPYHDLPRRHFDLVVEMLAGHYADTRLRELTPRVQWNRITQRISARRSAARLLYTSGGTIPDRGYYQLRVHGSMARIGELDEEFVWERKINDRFTLGTQSWRIVQITHNDVIVTPAAGGAALAPFWRGEAISRDVHLSDRLSDFLEWADGRLGSRGREAGTLDAALRERYPLTESASHALVSLLESQRSSTGVSLPHGRHIVVERVRDPQENTAEVTLVLHLSWGGRLLRPFAMAMAAAWEQRYGTVVDITQDDDALMLRAPHDIPADELLSLVDADRIEELLRDRLEFSGFFGARFRENAGRALLLPRAGFDRRVPLWLNRQRSKKLLTSVAEHRDFPMVLETWRTCLFDEFDLQPLRARLDAIAAGGIQVSECVTSTPSPFAAGLTWNLTNRLMYADDAAEGGASSGGSLHPDLLRELVHNADLRPRVERAQVLRLQAKLQRTFPGYAPRPGDDLVEWVKERLLIPLPEWLELIEAVHRDHGKDGTETRNGLPPGRLIQVESVGAGSRLGRDPNHEITPFIVALEVLPRLLAAQGDGSGAIPDLSTWVLTDPGAEGQSRVDTKEIVNLLSSISSGASGASGSSGASGLSGTSSPTASDDDTEDDSGASFLSQWLRFYAPVAVSQVERYLPWSQESLGQALSLLIDDGVVVVDRLIESLTSPQIPSELEVCDVENLERLLRLARRERRPQIEALPLTSLPLFLAVHQGVAPRKDGLEGLQGALDHLFGYSAPAAVWESDFIPSRLDPYHPAWLDSLMQDGELVWRGTGRERLTFLFRSDLDLLPSPGSAGGRDGVQGDDENPPEDPGPADGELVESKDRLRDVLEIDRPASLLELSRRTGRSTGPISDDLWQLAWRGLATNDTFQAVRRGVTTGFAAEPTPDSAVTGTSRSRSRGRSSARGLRSRWGNTRSFVGRWSRLAVVDPPENASADPLEREEIQRERAHLVLQRYGIVFRELLQREEPGLRWGDLFRALRLMELSGEIVSGYFFQGVPGLQFATPSAVRRLRRGLPEDLIYWISALDPSSPSALGLPLPYATPRRLAGNHMVFHGSRLCLVSERRGRRLEILVPPEHPNLVDYLEPLRAQLGRSVDAANSIEVDEINGQKARQSPYRPLLAQEFQLSSGATSLRLWRRHG